jgi:alpha-ketoglutarate-dependent 2,4-dichlorophenoxyacetate dioxygenase
MDDDTQIAFSENFGPLETTLSANPAAGTKFARQSNLDIMTGEPIPPDDMRMIYQKANYFWHSDSSFKRVPSLCSILTARICPPEGGNTEFLNMRAAWDALPPALQATIHPLVAEHALAHSRDRVQKGILSAKSLSELPPVKQRMFRDNPINGRRALYIGAHAGRILDWPEPMSKAILWELAQRAEQPEFMMSHAWREGDVIVWDNRAVLHRATYYDATKHKRLMQRTTIGGDELTVPQ